MNLFKRKNKFETELVKVSKQEEEKIKLFTLLDLVQNGHLIGLKVKDCDSEDAMYRILEFENFRVHFSEWSEWTIRIDVYNGNESFEVYRSSGLKIDWYSSTVGLAQWEKGSLNVEWSQEGAWCSYILKKIKEEKQKLDLKRVSDTKIKELEEKQQEERLRRDNEEKKKNFNNLFQNKL